MEKQTLTEILQNRHFNQLAAVLAIAQAPGWRMRHPEMPSVRSTLDRLVRLVSGGSFTSELREQFTVELMRVLASIRMADPDVFYTDEDLGWLVGVLSGEDAAMIMSMLFAVAGTRHHWYTAEQLSEITGTAAVTWRKRAAANEISGAHKLGKTWLFHAQALRAYGVKLDTPINIEVEGNEE